uniref:Carboxylesterase n=1 Tax=Glyphodes pyloalis TaxID=1242752 RepID=A0A6G7S6Y8_GLYPY|nr:carboxylesterase [Glyphodes pyloalis]
MATGTLSWLCVAFVICLGWVVCDDREERIVRIEQGPVRGYKEKGDSIFTFYGIPYASAPTGKDKFKAPLPGPAWLSVLDAVNREITCPQATIYGTTFPGTVQENCLVANIYVPETSKKNLPVVVYVHGGGYQVGSGILREPKNLVRTKNVIAVTFNYRLGIYGFLCLGTNEAPGNAGMKDQVALLRWVKKNIASYGGNPEDVTIAGYSAGSSAVDLLVLSPLAKDLFNKVIPESGANLAPWSVQIDPLENAKLFAKSKGFKDVDDVYALEEFYTSASMDLLISTGGFFDRTDVSFVFTPCVEQKTSKAAFLTDSPYNIVKSGKYNKVPMLYGFADMEGLLRIAQFDSWKDKINANFSAFLPVDLKFDSEKEREEVSNKVKKFYFGDKPVSQDNILAYIDFMSDVYFGYSSLKAVKLYAGSGNNKVYLYEYNFVDNSAPAIPYTDNVKGATHCAQTLAVLDGIDFMSQDTDETDISEEYKKMKSVVREIWINFITTGTPVPLGSSLPTWPAVGADGAPHMALGRELQLRGALIEERVRFWDTVYERHYRVPQPPPQPPTRHTEL